LYSNIGTYIAKDKLCCGVHDHMCQHHIVFTEWCTIVVSILPNPGTHAHTHKCVHELKMNRKIANLLGSAAC